MSNNGGGGGAGSMGGGGGGGGGGDGQPGGDGGDGSCFHGESQVIIMPDEMKVPMKDLTIGDIILTLDEEGHKAGTNFLGWLHRDDAMESDFLMIETEETTITVTSNHLIKNSLGNMMFAGQVELGDELVSSKGEPTKVISITETTMTGVFSPLTMAGTLLVNGLLVSCYANTLAHNAAHAFFAPVRVFPWILETTQTQNKEGIRAYPLMLKTVLPIM